MAHQKPPGGRRPEDIEVTILPPEGKGWRTEDGTWTSDGPGLPDMDALPDIYDGILLKRVLAYGVDFVILGLLFIAGWLALSLASLLSFGLLAPLVALFGLILAPCYHGLLIGGQGAATIGMRMFGIHVRTLDGRRPTLLQAFIMAIVFYATVPVTGWLVLLTVFLNRRRRTLHDLLSGTVVVNRLI
jgi:uncharacterized RDD family membrane protein YckC